MPVSRKKKLELLDRRVRVAELALQGKPQNAIARELGVSEGTVSLDLSALRSEWKQSSQRDFQEKLGEDMARLELAYREAWEDYERSRRPFKKGAKPRPGDPRLMANLIRIIELRLRAMGALKGDTNVSIQQNNVALDLNALFGLKKPTQPDAIERKILDLERMADRHSLDVNPVRYQLPDEPLGGGSGAGPQG